MRYAEKISGGLEDKEAKWKVAVAFLIFFVSFFAAVAVYQALYVAVLLKTTVGGTRGLDGPVFVLILLLGLLGGLLWTIGLWDGWLARLTLVLGLLLSMTCSSFWRGWRLAHMAWKPLPDKDSLFLGPPQGQQAV